MKFKLTTSPIKVDRNIKPKGSKIGTIKNSLRIKKELTIKELADEVLDYTYAPAVMNGGEASDWQYQQIFCLDFDNGYEPEEFISRCEGLLFTPNIIYSSKSDSPELRKWRAIWCIDDEDGDNSLIDFSDKDNVSKIRKILIDAFPGSDTTCSNADRIFFPGKSIIYINEKDITEKNYFYSLLNDMSKNLYNKEFKEYTSFSDFEEIQIDTIRNYNWNNTGIKIIDEFFTKQVRYDYETLFGLATNLRYIEGGLKKMKERMNEINRLGGGITLDNKIKKYEAKHLNIFNVSKKQYFPYKVSSFSPYEEDKGKFIIPLFNKKKGEVVIDVTIKKKTLKEAELLLESEFNKAINYHESSDSLFDGVKIFIFRLATGLGKTQIIEKVNNTLIATPTHLLKNELKERRSNIGLTTLTTPEGLEFSHDDINNYITSCQECGLYDNITELLNKIKTNKSTLKLNGLRYNITQSDKIQAELFSEMNIAAINTTDTVITTHHRAIYDTRFKHDCIVFDEDPLQVLINIKSCNMDWSCFDQTPWKSKMNQLETWYRSIELDKFYKVRTDNELLKDRGFLEWCMLNKKGDIIQLLQSEWCQMDSQKVPGVTDASPLKFFSESKLPINKNLIILSATAPVDVYKSIYKNVTVEVIEADNVELMGELIQYTNRSFSTTSIRSKNGYKPEVYSKLKEVIGNIPVITHLNVKTLFEKRCQISKLNMFLHFGNCSGFDGYKGQDIAVIGTPNKPLFVYKYYGLLSGLDINTMDFTLAMRSCEWRGMKFKFYTFEDVTLQKIHFELLESELIQAVGRSRLLRNKARVYLFSSFPLYQTTKFITENYNIYSLL